MYNELMAQKLCKVYIRVTRGQPSICLCTPSAVPPTIVTSWLLQASGPAQPLPHSPPILGSVPYMSNVWHPIQWVTRPGLTFRTKCQSLWKMQTGRSQLTTVNSSSRKQPRSPPQNQARKIITSVIGIFCTSFVFLYFNTRFWECQVYLTKS